MPATKESIESAIAPAAVLSAAWTSESPWRDLPFEGIAPAVVHFYFAADASADSPRTAQLPMHQPSGSSIALSVATLLLLPFIALLGGCQSAHVPHSAVAQYAGNDPGAQLDFWHELATRPLTSNDDTFHALLLYLDGKDDAQTYDQRVAALKSRGLLPASFNEPADLAVHRGDLAVCIVKILKLKGGWAMRVFGPTPRYALRELVYDGVYPPSSPQQTFSGAEFVGVIGKLEDSQRAAALTWAPGAAQP